MNIDDILKPDSRIKRSEEQLNDIFRNEIIKPDANRIIFKALDQYFRSTSYDQDIIAKHYYTFWKFYVLSTWKDLSWLDKKTVLRIVPNQFCTAHSLDIKVIDRLLHYMNAMGDRKLVSSFFRELKTVVENETSYVNPTLKNEGFRVNVLYKKFKGDVAIEKLEQARMTAELERQLFGTDKPLMYLDDGLKQKVLSRFLSFFDVLINIKDAAKLVITFVDTLSGDLDITEGDLLALAREEAGTEENIDKLNDLGKKDNQSSPPQLKLTTTQKVNYSKIVSDLKNEYSFDENDQTADFGAVLSRLEQLSKTLNDPAVAELYYYDEGSGQFKWNK